MTNTINTACTGSPTTGVYHRHDGSRVYLLIEGVHGEVWVDHAHNDPTYLTTLLKGRTVTVWTNTMLGTSVIDW